MIRFTWRIDSNLYAIFDCDCTVDATAVGTKAGKMSVKTSICSPPFATFHHSTVECRPAELNRFESIFWCESNWIEIIFGELKCTSKESLVTKCVSDDLVFTARQHSYYAERCISYSKSIRPSVCLSVTCWHCVNMTYATIMGSLLEDSPMNSFLVVNGENARCCRKAASFGGWSPHTFK